MAVDITIEGVPEEVRERLAERATLQGQSIQEFLRDELQRMASHPSMSAWLREVRARKKEMGTRIPPSTILGARDVDRV